MVNNKKGIAMLIVIGITLALLILGGAVVLISLGHFGTSYHQINRARAFYAAEAAMQDALWKCRENQYPFNDPAQFPYEDPSPPTITDPNYQFTPRIAILLPGQSYQISVDESYDCPTNVSDYCVLAIADY